MKNDLIVKQKFSEDFHLLSRRDGLARLVSWSGKVIETSRTTWSYPYLKADDVGGDGRNYVWASQSVIGNDSTHSSFESGSIYCSHSWTSGSL